MSSGFEAVIGLEIHVQLQTRSKMFCACPNRFGGDPNTRVCPICLGLPGALPVLNREAVRSVLQLGLALHGEVRAKSTFYRKQYFYPDLPKGYQITQGPVAVIENARLALPGDSGVRGTEVPVEIGIERIHLEEDAGKSSHEGKRSLVDLNRAGVPLLEIVGAPELRSPLEASEYLKALHHLVIYLGVSDGNMEEGSFRCDANVSVRREGEQAFGTRVEVKNLNSFRHVRQALEYEIARHTAVLEAGGSLTPETRGFDAGTGETRPQRSKEAAMDYRYFPEPDLPELQIAPDEIEAARRALPELPEARKTRLVAVHGLTEYEAGMLIQTRHFGDFFDEVVASGASGKQACNWMLGEVSRVLNERGVGIEDLKLTAGRLAELVRLVEAGTISLSLAKADVFPEMLNDGSAPADIVARKGLSQVSDEGAIEALVREVLGAHPEQVAGCKAGRGNLRGFLVGQVMKAGQGKVNPRKVNEVLDRCLGEA